MSGPILESNTTVLEERGPPAGYFLRGSKLNFFLYVSTLEYASLPHNPKIFRKVAPPFRGWRLGQNDSHQPIGGDS